MTFFIWSYHSLWLWCYGWKMGGLWITTFFFFLCIFFFIFIRKLNTLGLQYNLRYDSRYDLRYNSTHSIERFAIRFRFSEQLLKVETNKHNYNYVIIKNILSPSLKRCPFYLKFVSNYKIAMLEVCTALKHIHFLYNNRLCNKNPTSGTSHHFTLTVVSNSQNFLY